MGFKVSSKSLSAKMAFAWIDWSKWLKAVRLVNQISKIYSTVKYPFRKCSFYRSFKHWENMVQTLTPKIYGNIKICFSKNLIKYILKSKFTLAIDGLISAVRIVIFFIWMNCLLLTCCSIYRHDSYSRWLTIARCMHIKWNAM